MKQLLMYSFKVSWISLLAIQYLKIKISEMLTEISLFYNMQNQKKLTVPWPAESNHCGLTKTFMVYTTYKFTLMAEACMQFTYKAIFLHRHGTI